MKSPSHSDSAQVMQRVRVGMTGLVTVMIVIGLAMAIFSSATDEAPVSAIGAPNSTVVANMTDGNTVVQKIEDKAPDLGVAPSTGTAEPVNSAAAAPDKK
jgi:cobalamin synthase